MEFAMEMMKIVEGAIKLDKTKVVNYTSLLANKLEENGEFRIAIKFRKLLESAKTTELQPTSLQSVFKVPIDQESRLPMADIYMPNEIDHTVILNKDIRVQVDKFLDYYSNMDKLMSTGLSVPNTILMYGPPGCGKTILAKLLAKQLNLPVVIARLDGLISSFLGSTSKNIRIIFEYAHKVPCVLFLDEFDALAKIRDDNRELGELKRVVNSLLQNIDSLRNGSIIIAATNHEQLLDSAVWRRFAFKLHIDKPDNTSRIELIRIFFADTINENDVEILSSMFKGLTGSEIEEICNKSLMDSIIGDEPINLNMVASHYFELLNLFKGTDREDLSEKDIEKTISEHLRGLNPKVFSYSCIARILGRSKSHVANLLK